MYRTVYDMCTQKPPHDYSAPLYCKYRDTFNDYLSKIVMPALEQKFDESMLRESVVRWGNHKIMVRWLSRFFGYLDRYYIGRHSYPTLDDVGSICFRGKFLLLFMHEKESILVLKKNR